MILLVDEDEKYLEKLEIKFVRELSTKAEIQIITRREILKEYFLVPRTIEILAISEKLYSEEVQKHNINHLFILRETGEKPVEEKKFICYINKYIGIKEVYNELTYQSMDCFKTRYSICKEK